MMMKTQLAYRVYPERIVHLQEVAKLQKRVEASERGVEGFEDSVEQLRAAGRMEAMQDLMQTVKDALVCSAVSHLCACSTLAYHPHIYSKSLFLRYQFCCLHVASHLQATREVPDICDCCCLQNELQNGQTKVLQGTAESKEPASFSGHAHAMQPVERPLQPPLSRVDTQSTATFAPDMPTASGEVLVSAAMPKQKDAEVKSGGGAVSLRSGQGQWGPVANLDDCSSLDASKRDDITSSTPDDDSYYQEDCDTVPQREVPTASSPVAEAGGAGNSGTATEGAHVSAANNGHRHQAVQHHSQGRTIEQAPHSDGKSVKISSCSVDTQAQSCGDVVPSTVQGASMIAEGQFPSPLRDATTSAAGQVPSPSPSSPRGRMSTMFKSKAMGINKEKRLGSIARFATQSLADSIAQVEQCVPSNFGVLVRSYNHSGPETQGHTAGQSWTYFGL